MPRSNPLHFHEEIMLLALEDRRGTVDMGSMYKYAVGGGILAELLLADRIRIRPTKRHKMVELVDASPTGDPIIDECLEKIRSARRPASLETWVSRITGLSKLRDRLALQLCRRGIVRASEEKVLLIFKRQIYPEINPIPEQEIIQRLRTAIFTDTRQIDPRTVVLLALSDGAGLLPMVFDKKAVKQKAPRIAEIVNGELTGQATKKAIEAMRAAVMVACIMPAIITTTTVSH